MSKKSEAHNRRVLKAFKTANERFKKRVVTKKWDGMGSRDYETVAQILEHRAACLIGESEDSRRHDLPGTSGPSLAAKWSMKRTGTNRYGTAARRFRAMAKFLRQLK